MSDVASQGTKAEFAAQLARRLEEALGTDAFPNPEGWRFEGHKLLAVRGGDNRVEADTSPVFYFALPDRTLELTLAEHDAEKPAFFHTAHYDIVYRSESAEQSHRVYEIDRGILERFCQWVVSWDGAAAAPEPSTEALPTEALAGAGQDAAGAGPAAAGPRS